jgi:signal transduction histidine kinase
MNTPEEFETLKKENENLKKNNAVKSDLISISAHQLRTSLSALKWIFKMFLDRDLGAITGEQEGLIKKAYESNERMIHLVNDMLTLNHVEDTALTFKMADTDMLALMEETLFEFSGESHKKNIEIIFLKPTETLSKVSCDKEMIRVVFQNLVENAIKYSAEGDKVFCSMREQDEAIEISVRDTGIGIPKDDQENIFAKFFRAPNAKDKDIIGSGLGLYTTKNIVDHHKGKIWFESSEKGTTFFVVLPLKQ